MRPRIWPTSTSGSALKYYRPKITKSYISKLLGLQKNFITQKNLLKMQKIQRKLGKP
jgi:hypothetical protein